MKIQIFFFTFSLGLIFTLDACIDKANISTVDIPTDTVYLHHHEAPQKDFPKDWIGTYEGEMNWYSNGRLNAKIPITIEIAEIDSLENSWIWRTTYDSTASIPRKMVKDYRLIQPDTLAKHRYIIDERNGILLDANFIDNTLYSSFEVSNNRLLSTTKLVHDKLYQEIIMSPVLKNRLTYATEGKDTFFVDGLQEVVVQKAVLSLKK